LNGETPLVLTVGRMISKSALRRRITAKRLSISRMNVTAYETGKGKWHRKESR